MKIPSPLLKRTLPRLALVALAAVGVSSCIVAPGRHHHGVAVLAPPLPLPVPIAVLPYGARPVYVRGERCWVHHGTYYRRHSRGYSVFVP